MKRSELTVGMVVTLAGGDYARVLSTDTWRHLRGDEDQTTLAIGIETYYVHGVPDPHGEKVAVQRVVKDCHTIIPTDRAAILMKPENLGVGDSAAFRHYVQGSNARIRDIEQRDTQYASVRAFWGDESAAAEIAAMVNPKTGKIWEPRYADLLALGKIHYRAMQAQKGVTA